MNNSETAALIQWLALLDPRHGTGQDADRLALKAQAWHEVLPSEITIPQAKAICTELLAAERAITPGLIYQRYAQAKTPKDRPGVDSQPRPIPPASQVITADNNRSAIGAAEPVRPQDVPGYRSTKVEQPSEVLSVTCPFCEARPAEPCNVPSHEQTGRRNTRYPHPSRYEAAGLSDPVSQRLAGQAVAGA